jgi:hypothetical protein
VPLCHTIKDISDIEAQNSFAVFDHFGGKTRKQEMLLLTPQCRNSKGNVELDTVFSSILSQNGYTEQAI